MSTPFLLKLRSDQSDSKERKRRMKEKEPAIKNNRDKSKQCYDLGLQASLQTNRKSPDSSNVRRRYGNCYICYWI